MRRVALAALAAAAVLGGWIGVHDVIRGYWTTRGAQIERFTLTSRLVGRDLHEVLVTPAGGGNGRALLVFLHGRSSRPDSVFDQTFFDALRNLGARAPDVLLLDGGDHSYWHDRADGRWGSSVLREAIPEGLRRSGADAKRVAIGGISMGGFGALDLARLAPQRFCRVGGHAAAIWFRGADTAAGAFDDAGDFGRHDLIRLARARRPIAVPVWIDVGRDDPFFAADVALARELRRHGTPVRLWVHAGGHEGWSRRMPRYLRFYAGC